MIGDPNKRTRKEAHHLKAILIGVVRQDVNTSAGNSALYGRVSCASHAPSRIQSLVDPEELEATQS